MGLDLEGVEGWLRAGSLESLGVPAAPVVEGSEGDFGKIVR